MTDCVKMLMVQRSLTFNFNFKKIRSPLLKNSKKSRTEPNLCSTKVHVKEAAASGRGAEEAPAADKRQGKAATITDEAMPLKKGLKSHSSENLSRNHISNTARLDQHRKSLQKEDNPICNLPLPLSLALGISSLSDSKLYSYHNSQDFLTFLTKSARDVEKAERNHTIDTALSQIKELKNLVEENMKLLRFVLNTQEYNPSSEIDDVIVSNISTTLQNHSSSVEKMCERAKEYKNQLLLAESDLDTNNSQEMKSDLLAMNKTLSWMSMIIRYHMWGSNVADESLYHSDDDVINQHRKLGRRNCIRVRERPKWCEETSATVVRQLSGQTSNIGRTVNKQTGLQANKQTLVTHVITPSVKVKRTATNLAKKNKG